MRLIFMPYHTALNWVNRQPCRKWQLHRWQVTHRKQPNVERKDKNDLKDRNFEGKRSDAGAD